MTKRNINVVHYIVIAFFCFGFHYLPTFSQMTPYGMGILGTFIGAVYGWSTLGMIWPSLMALLGIGWVIGINPMLAGSFGNYTIAGMIFLFTIVAVLIEVGAMDWLVNRILTSRLMLGKPWLTIWFLFFGALIGGMLNGAVMAIIFSQFFIGICKNVGIKPYTKLPTLVMIGIALSLMVGQVTIPFLGTGILLLGSYSAMFHTSINFVTYMVFMIPAALLIITAYVLLMRFVFRADVSQLRSMTASMLGEKQAITKDQKQVLSLFGLFVVGLLLTSLPFLGPVYKFASAFGFFGISVFFVCVMMMLKREDGSPLLNFHKAARDISWDPILLLAFIMVIAGYMNTPETGITASLASLLAPLTQFSPMVFIILALLLATVITNFANNIIVVVMFMPVIVGFMSTQGLSATSTVAVLFLCTQFALCTPGASPMTAICFGMSEIIRPSDMMKYAALSLPLLFIICLVFCIPFANLVF